MTGDRIIEVGLRKWEVGKWNKINEIENLESINCGFRIAEVGMRNAEFGKPSQRARSKA